MPKNWYLVSTKSGQQERAEHNLKAQDIDTYLPRMMVEKARGKITIEPVFPGYVFASFDPEVSSVKAIHYTRGCSRVIQFGGQIAKCPDAMIEALRSRFDHQEVVSMVARPGDQVEIVSGPMTGLTAIYQEPDKHKRSYLLVDMLGKLQSVKVTDSDYRIVST